ncbi:MAG: ABC transporter ATP-binding protein [Steroidobacteraceae bacterium]
MNAPGTAIYLSDLKFGWTPGRPFLEIAQFSVARGERVFLQGRSGCGKSTLLGLIGGVLEPVSGSVNVLGQSLQAMRRPDRDHFRAAHVGFIFQMFNLIPYLSILDNVLLPLEFSRERRMNLAMRGLQPGPEARRLLGALGLDDDAMLERQATALSQGQQQRVAAARALIGQPDVLVADEPTSSLDADARQSFLTLLMDECTNAGTTVVFVSHDASLGSLFDRTVAFSSISHGGAA